MALPLLCMKAPSALRPFDDPKIRYPLWGSIKYDGFRMVNLCGEALITPALKPFPNVHIWEHFKTLFEVCKDARIVTDGEVWSPLLTFQELQSIIRSHDKEIPWHVGYYIFDYLDEDEWNGINEVVPYYVRYQSVQNLDHYEHVFPVKQTLIQSAREGEDWFTTVIDNDCEGLMLRSPNFGYKHNRCTPNENGLWKFKEFHTEDAVIVDVQQRYKMLDNIARVRNAAGLLEQVHYSGAYELDEAVGAFVVRWHDQQFAVTPGRGFTYDDRKKWWLQYKLNPSSFIGQWCEFKFMPHGTKDKPRIGSLVRFRPDKCETPKPIITEPFGN